jgi:hypothetical protein
MNTQNIEQWASQAELLAGLVDNLPHMLMAAASLPKTDNATELLEALLRVRQALRLPSPNTSFSPLGDKLVQVREDLRPALGQLYASVEKGIAQCVQHGARHPSILPASDFQGALHRLDLDHLVGRQVLLGRLDALPVDHALRRQLPDGGYVMCGGVQAVVLGPVPSAPPDAPLPVQGRWYYSSEVTAVTRSWRQTQKSREAEHQEAELRRRLEREERSRDPMARRAAELEALSAAARMGSR